MQERGRVGRGGRAGAGGLGQRRGLRSCGSRGGGRRGRGSRHRVAGSGLPRARSLLGAARGGRGRGGGAGASGAVPPTHGKGGAGEAWTEGLCGGGEGGARRPAPRASRKKKGGGLPKVWDCPGLGAGLEGAQLCRGPRIFLGEQPRPPRLGIRVPPSPSCQPAGPEPSSHWHRLPPAMGALPKGWQRRFLTGESCGLCPRDTFPSKVGPCVAPDAPASSDLLSAFAAPESVGQGLNLDSSVLDHTCPQTPESITSPKHQAN